MLLLVPKVNKETASPWTHISKSFFATLMRMENKTFAVSMPK